MGIFSFVDFVLDNGLTNVEVSHYKQVADTETDGEFLERLHGECLIENGHYSVPYSGLRNYKPITDIHWFFMCDGQQPADAKSDVIIHTKNGIIHGYRFA